MRERLHIALPRPRGTGLVERSRVTVGTFLYSHDATVVQRQMPETLLLEAPLGDAGQKRALEDDESGKRKARRVQVKNK